VLLPVGRAAANAVSPKMMLVMAAVFILMAASMAMFDQVLRDYSVGRIRCMIARGMESVTIRTAVDILLFAPFFYPELLV
jgi:hypothetical protein